LEQLFAISRFGCQDVKEHSSKYNGLHVHDYEELMIGQGGEIEHVIDFRSKLLPAPFVSFIAQGKSHLVKPMIREGLCDIWVVNFKSEFIPETIFQLYDYYHDHADMTLEHDPAFARMGTLCQMMFDEMQQPIPELPVIKNLLNTLFAMIESERRKRFPGETVTRTTQNTTFKNFLKILEDNFRRPEGVDFYASKLFMTSRNLNLICRNVFQKSVSEIIETRKLIEAKNLLMQTGKTVAEIGFELGYNEKAYFTSVFKKKTGQTPTEFREEMAKLIS